MNPAPITCARAARPGRRFLTGLWLVLALRMAHQPVAAQTPTIVSFTNSSAISIPFYGQASNYPSVITVPCLSGTLQKVTVTLSGLTDPAPAFVEILLAGPSGPGQAVDLMYDQGSGSGVNDVTLTFDDEAAAPLPANGQITPGTYQTDDGIDNGDNPPPTTNALAGFIGTVLEGDWSLYVFDSGSFPITTSGAISNGWSLTFYYFPLTQPGPVQFSSPQINGLGQFQATLSGPEGTPVVIETSTDLLTWTPIATNDMAASSVVFTDTNAPTNQLFYQAVVLSPPATVQFGSPEINGTGQFQATLSGPVGTPLVIETSADLETWTPIATNAMATSSVVFTDTNAPTNQLFYRVTTCP